MSDSLEGLEVGWARYFLKSKIGFGCNFTVADVNGTLLFYIDGKAGLRTKADVKDPQGTALIQIRGKFIDIPKRMTFIKNGQQIGKLKAKLFSPVKSTMILTMSDNSEWVIEGNLIEKNYAIFNNGVAIARLEQKWLTIRDRYCVDIVDGVDTALVLGLVWAVDVWREENSAFIG